MNRLIYKLFTVAAAISILMVIVAALLWVMSPVDVVVAGGRYYLGIDPRGQIEGSIYGVPPQVGDMFRPSRGWSAGGLRYSYAPGFTSGQYAYHLALPIWPIIVLCTILPASWYALIRRRRRIHSHRLMNGLCLICGYDLRASADRCPECGIIASPDLPGRGLGAGQKTKSI